MTRSFSYTKSERSLLNSLWLEVVVEDEQLPEYRGYFNVCLLLYLLLCIVFTRFIDNYRLVCLFQSLLLLSCILPCVIRKQSTPRFFKRFSIIKNLPDRERVTNCDINIYVFVLFYFQSFSWREY